MVISLVSFGLLGPALSTTNINIVKWRYFVIFSPVFFLFLELGIFLFKLGKNILFGIGNTTEYRSSKRAKKNPVSDVSMMDTFALNPLSTASSAQVVSNVLLTSYVALQKS